MIYLFYDLPKLKFMIYLFLKIRFLLQKEVFFKNADLNLKMQISNLNM